MITENAYLIVIMNISVKKMNKNAEKSIECIDKKKKTSKID